MISPACLWSRGDHARTCPRCRLAASQDRAVQAAADRAAPEPLPARARQRALDAAFAARPAARPRRARVLVPAGLALAAAAALALAWVARREAVPVAPIALAASDAIAIGHARVQLAAGGVAWRTGDAEVTLVSGRVDVEVDPAPHRRFRVATPSFHVDVLGTAFAVDLERVEVRRGAVRITTPAGAVLVDRLTAGQRWSSKPQTARAPEPAPSPEVAVAAEGEIEMDPVPEVPTVAPRGPAAHRARSAQAWLSEARSLVAGGDVAGARAAVRRALASQPSRAMRADAEALIAESYLRAGEIDTAITHFLGVADRYRDLATGEAALFAAARYEARTDRDAGRRRFQIYLQRYPAGSLAAQARVQLRALGGP